VTRTADGVAVNEKATSSTRTPVISEALIAQGYRLFNEVLIGQIEPVEEAGVTVEGARGKVTGKVAKVTVIEAGVSKNKNRWRNELLVDSLMLIEGAKVFYDHKFFDREVQDLVGRLKGVQMEGGKMTAYLHSLEAATWYRSVVKEAPDLLGLSVFVIAKSEEEVDEQGEPTGICNIMEIKEVISVDLVGNPSAGGGVNQVLEGTTPPVQREKELEMTKELKALEDLVDAGKLESTRLQKEIEDLKAELKVAKESNGIMGEELKGAQEELAKHAAKAVIEQALSEAKTAGKDIRPMLEEGIREALEGRSDVTPELCTKVIEKALARAKALVDDYAPKTQENGIAPAPAPLAKKDGLVDVDKVAEAIVFDAVGVI